MLAGTASTPSVPTSAVYQFDDQHSQNSELTNPDADPVVFKNTTVRIRLSDDLAKAVPAGKTIAVKSYTLTTKSFPNGMCRTDIDIDYSPRGRELYKVRPDERFDETDDTVVSSIPSDGHVYTNGDFVTKDLSHITDVSGCGNEVGLFPFEYIAKDGKIKTFASVEINTLTNPKDPGLSIKGDVVGADVNATGRWETDTNPDN